MTNISEVMNIGQINWNDKHKDVTNIGYLKTMRYSITSIIYIVLCKELTIHKHISLWGFNDYSTEPGSIF